MNKKMLASKVLGLARSLIADEGKKPDRKTVEPELIKFLFDKNNPLDKDIHEWAEKRGYNVHDVEAIIYRLASLYANIALGGRASKDGFTEKDADPKELEMGIEVEKEHTPDPEVAKIIALAHLSELKDYYTRLKKMEADGEGK
jgi:hypothetical protein